MKFRAPTHGAGKRGLLRRSRNPLIFLAFWECESHSPKTAEESFHMPITAKKKAKKTKKKAKRTVKKAAKKTKRKVAKKKAKVDVG